VFFDYNMIFDGNEPHSPQTVTTWLGFESYRQLSTSASVVDLRFTRSLDPGSYVLTLVFRNNTRGYDCSPVTQSRSLP
jgi:hypothetical protein